MDTTDFVYELPDAAVAQSPVEPRDSSRLLRTSDRSDHRFSELPELLSPGDLVVVNDTRVRAARIRGTKVPTGGAVEVLLLARRPDDRWDALVRPARRLRRGSVVEAGRLRMVLVDDPVDGRAIVDVDITHVDADGDVEAAIAAQGEIPLPPYFTGALDDPERYQTVYASAPGSAAAPTAGLHFTPQVLEGLADRGIAVARVELRVGLDTFRPISTPHIEDHRMHSEWASVPDTTARAVSEARTRGGSVVAIGTTVVRALESQVDEHGELVGGESTTDLFITPGYRFGVVDRLVTNYHLPGSTLLCLVAAFMGPAWRDVYGLALERGYRFLSFGDAMLADREER